MTLSDEDRSVEFLLKEEPEGFVHWIKSNHKGLQRILLHVFWVSIVLYSLGYMLRGRKPSPQNILPSIQKEPIQTKVNRKPFSFAYRKVNFKVRPVAKYELWGLVVSHNNINSFWDSYHDKNSLDTKDLCVIWGSNVKTLDFHKVKVWSGSWTCYFRYPGGVRFDHNKLSNNHLITNKQSIRDQISKVRIGDQIHLSGFLANYKRDLPKWRWRRTSTSRKDSGNTACEVVFVDQLNILAKGTPLWYFLADFFFWIWLLALALKIALFAITGETFYENKFQQM